MADQRAAVFTLGSASPRRADLLTRLGVAFDVATVDIDEAALVDPAQQDPQASVERIARAKFAAFGVEPAQRPLLTADTLVACDGSILGKPNSSQHLSAMLMQMSGRPLQITTAVCVGVRGEQPAVDIVTTLVELHDLEPHEVARYIATGAGMDKAGGLALQAEAKPFIRSIAGCWANVMGLPLCAARRLLLAGTGSSVESDAGQCSVELCGSHDR